MSLSLALLPRKYSLELRDMDSQLENLIIYSAVQLFCSFNFLEFFCLFVCFLMCLFLYELLDGCMTVLFKDLVYDLNVDNRLTSCNGVLLLVGYESG